MGRTVLVQLRDAKDRETGQRYTVKRYESEKAPEGSDLLNKRVTLKPLNHDFKSIELAEGDVQVIAEMIEVLGV
jgi:SOS-response transcriptional repressor LexA